MSSRKRKASELSSDCVEVASESHPEKKYYYHNVTKQSTSKRQTKKIHENKILDKEPQSRLHIDNSKKTRLDIITYEAVRTERSTNHIPVESQPTGNKAEISTPKEIINQVTKRKKKKKNKKKHKDNLLTAFKNLIQSKDSINVRAQGTMAPVSSTIHGKKSDLDNSKTCQKLITGPEDDDKHTSKTKNYNLGASGLAQDRPPVNFQLKKKEKQLAIFQNMFRFSKLKSKKLTEVDSTSKEKQENIASSKKKINSDANDGSTESLTSLGCPTKIKDRIIQHVKEDKEFQETLRHLLTQSRDNVNIELLDDDNSMIVDEEMDWLAEQEVMIEHIKSMRKNMDTTDEICSEFTTFSKDGQKDLENNNLILVFDTNVFISCLPFIKGIQDTTIPGLGLPTLYIPWRVLHELDHLKSSTNKQLQLSARKAIRYINDTFSSRHRRVTGQSFEEYTSMRSGEKLLPDDEILKICLNLRMTGNHRAVVLITNDKNLESKAIMSKVESYSTDRFMKEKLEQDSLRSSIEGVNMPLKKPDPVDSVLFAKLKYLLKNLLEEILKTELINAFGKDWPKIVRRKPPWTLIDILECFIKHWRSVFTFVFRKDVLSFVENIKKYFLEAEGKNVSVSEVIENSRDLLVTMRDNIIPKRTSYDEKLKETITEVESLNKTEEKPNTTIPDDIHEKDFTESSSHMCVPESSNRTQNIFMDSPMFDEQQCREKVKALFQVVWESVKNYCCRISELVSTSGMNSTVIDQVKYQYPNVMRALQELIQFIEKILSSEPEEIAQSYQLIQDFTNLLVNLNVFQVEASEMNDLSQYIGFFCCDNESRAILQILINDLRQFAWQIMNSVKALGFV